MSRDNAAIDFNLLIDDLFVKANVVTKSKLTVWGGEFSLEKLGEFIEAWSLDKKDMTWCIWEHVHRITFGGLSIPGELEMLERGRVFGPHGDLSLRRDGERFIWRFVGAPGLSPPGGFVVKDFWNEKNSDLHLHLSEEQALLWGEKREQQGVSRWAEDRVAGCELNYPGMEGHRRVSIKYREYSLAGQVQFVWFTGLEGWHGEKR